MDSSRFREIERLFLAAIELSGEHRASFLRAQCGDDTLLLAEVEGMLAHDGAEFLEGASELHECVDQALASTGRPATAPEQIGPYRILRRTGLGGMGTVYEAEQASPRRRVALKVIRHDALSKESLSRFRYEGELLGRLQHPGIAQIFEAGTFDQGDGPQPFFAMEFVDGGRLPDYTRRRGLSIQGRLELFASVCDAMQHAHQQGIIHRDLKPDNILVTRDGQPKVLDFGVAYGVNADVAARTVQTRTGTIVGTMGYMSPEQLDGLPTAAVPGSDVYSLGVILFELLTERLPFDLNRKSLPEAARIIREDPPPPLGRLRADLCGDLELVVGKALAKEPERRYSDAGELASDVRRFLEHVPVLARPATTWYQVRKFAQRHRTGVAGVIATVLVLVGGIVTTSVQAVRASRNADAALAGKTAADRSAYRAAIAAASAGILLGDVDASRRQLEEVPEERRQWEWRHLNSQLDGTESVYPLHDESSRALVARTRLAFREDGVPLVAVLQGPRLRILDVESQQEIFASELAFSPSIAAMSPAGTRFAAVGPDHTLQVLDTASGEVRFEKRLPDSDTVIDLAFSSDAAALAVGTTHELLVLDAGEGRVLVEHRIPSPLRYQAMSFSGAGDHIALNVGEFDPASARWYEVEARLLDGRTGETIATRSLSDADLVAIDEDGTLVVSTSQTSPFQIWRLDGESLEARGMMGGHELQTTCVAFSQDGTLLASSSPERILIHRAPTWEEVGRISIPGLDPDALRWDPDGSRIAVAEHGKEVRVVRKDIAPFLEFTGHYSFVYVAAWSPDGTLIASADWDRKVSVWDALSGELLETWPCTGFVSMVAFSADGSRVLAWSDSIKAWDIATGMLVTNSPEHDLYREAREGKLPPGAKFVFRASGGHTGAMSADGTRLLYVKDPPDGQSEDARPLALIDLETGTERNLPRDQQVSMSAVAISHDKRRIAVGSHNGAIQVLDATTGELELQLDDRMATTRQQAAHEGDVHCMEFSADGRRLISGGDSARVVLWDLESGDEVMALQAHESYVHAVAYSRDGTRILSASGDGTLRAWDTVPLRDRVGEIRSSEHLRAELRPRVEQMLEDLGDAAEVARRLRSDPALEPQQLAAAERCLLECRRSLR